MKRQEVHQHIHFWLLLAIAFTMPFAIKINSLFIIGCLVNHIVEGKLLFHLKNTWSNVVNRYMLLFYALHVLSLFFSANVAESGAVLERKLVLLVFPLVMFKPIHQQQFKAIVFAFTAGVVMALTYCIGAATNQYLITGKTAVFFYHALAEQINIHAVYLAAYAVFALFMLIYIYHTMAMITRIILVTTMLFLAIGVVLLSSKMMLAILCLGMFYMLVKKYAWSSLQKGMLITSLTILGIIILLLPQVRGRFSTEFNSNFSVVKQTTYRYDTPFTGTTLRLVIWKYCFVILSREKAWITGVGTGDGQQLLDKQYKLVNMYTGNPELNDTGYLGYDSHNQYVETVFSLGIIGLATLLLLLGHQVIQAFKSRNPLFITFVFLNMLFFISESALSTNKGIVFYVFFSMVFLAHTTFSTKDASNH